MNIKEFFLAFSVFVTFIYPLFENSKDFGTFALLTGIPLFSILQLYNY